MKKNVLVTGAAGYIGQCVVKALLDSGADVLAVDLRPAGGVDSRARYVATDIFTSPLDELFAGRVPDACCHLAWQDGFRHNSPYHMGAVSQHYDLMRRLAECGVGQIAVMGTMHEIGYHEGYLNRLVKAQLGMCVSEYIIGYRIDEAKKLLDLGHSVTEAATACGFSELSYFSHCFKRIVGVTPREYKRSCELL